MRINWTLWIGYAVILAAIYFLHRFGGPSDTVTYIGFGLIIVLFVWRWLYYLSLKMWLRKNGVATTATLVSSYSTGARTNRNPVMRVTLQVNGVDGTNWQTTVSKTFYPEDLYKLQPGTQFNVLYDPRDKSKVVLN